HTATAATLPGKPAAARPADDDPLLGFVAANRYQIERRLGAGGMGVVYAARDLQLGRRVAVKVVRPRIDSATAQERLAREAQAMAKLRHPNVVTVPAIVSVGDQLLLVMELIEGGTLAEWLKTGPRSWRQVVQAFIPAARGLAAAHAAGFVHRDFKAENVLIDGDGTARVTDFGVARLIGEVPEES